MRRKNMSLIGQSISLFTKSNSKEKNADVLYPRLEFIFNSKFCKEFQQPTDNVGY